MSFHLTDEEAELFLENETNEFKDRFKNKINLLSSVVTDNSTVSNKEQLNSLHRYINDLNEQNDILVQTIEQLELDTNNRIQGLEKRVKEKGNRCDHLMLKIENYEEQKNENEKHMKLLEEETIMMGEENLQYQSHITNLENDIDEIILLVKRARSTGVWEFSKLNLRAVTLDSLLDNDSIDKPFPKPDITVATDEFIDKLKAQLKARDKTISMLEKDLAEKSKEYIHLKDTCSHTGEVVDSVKSDVRLLEKQQKYDTREMFQKDQMIKSLQEQMLKLNHQIDELNDDIDIKNDDIDHYQLEMNDLKYTLQLRSEDLKIKDQTIKLLEVKLSDNLKEERRPVKLYELQNKINKLEENLLLQENRYNEKCNEVLRYKNELEQLQDKQESEIINAKTLNLGLEKSQLELSKKTRAQVGIPTLSVDSFEMQMKKLQDQKIETESKVEVRDKAIERLQKQLKEFMEEITRRDAMVHNFELENLKKDEEKRRMTDQVERVAQDNKSLKSELTRLKEDHEKVTVEKGKLVAQVNAFQISNKSENTLLSDEVLKLEETISKLKHENEKLYKESEKLSEIDNERNVELEELSNELKEVNEKNFSNEKVILEKEHRIEELMTSLRDERNKVDEYEDEARSLVFKLNTVERSLEQEKHKVELNEEKVSDLLSDVDMMQADRKNLTFQIASLRQHSDKLSKENADLKKSVQGAEKKVHDYEEKWKNAESMVSHNANELEMLKQTSKDDFTTHEHKMALMEEELQMSHHRYEDINEELTCIEKQLEAMTERYKEASTIADQLLKKLEDIQDEKENLEMNLAVTSEKHETAIKENAQKDGFIMNLKSELSVTQQEFEEVLDELSQKSEEIENLSEKIEKLNSDIESLKAGRENSDAKHSQQVDHINELQEKNVGLTEELEHIKRLFDDLSKEQFQLEHSKNEIIDSMNREMEKQKQDLDIVVNKRIELEKEISEMKESNYMLSKELEEVTEKRQMSIRELEDYKDEMYEHQRDNGNVIKSLKEKISDLECDNHQISLEKSQVDSDLRLTQERLKHHSIELSNVKQQRDDLQNRVDEITDQVKNQDNEIRSKAQLLVEYEMLNESSKKKLGSSEQLKERLQEDLETAKRSLEDSKLRNSRCEEVIREMREKLANKIKEGEHEAQLTSQLQSEYHSLKCIHDKLQNEFNEVEQKNDKLQVDYLKQNLIIAEKQQEIDTFKSNISDLSENLDVALDERKKALNQIQTLEAKFTSLKNSLEKDNFSLLEENCLLKQKLKDTNVELKHVQDEIIQKDEEVRVVSEKVSSLDDEIEHKENEITVLKEEMYSIEQTLNQVDLQFRETLQEKKTLMNESSKSMENMNNMQQNFNELKHQYKDTVQKLAHYQEKTSLGERNLHATQGQLANRIAEVVKLDKQVKKFENTIAHLNEQLKKKHVQISQYESAIEKLHDDTDDMKHKYESCFEELEATKITASNYSKQLDDSQRQTEELSIQLERLQNSLAKEERSKEESKSRANAMLAKVESLSRELHDCRDMLNMHIEREEDFIKKLKDRDANNHHLRNELETCLDKNKSHLQQIATRDAELRVLRSELIACQKKVSQQEKQNNVTNEQLEQYRKEMRELKDVNMKSNTSLMNSEQEANKVRIEISSLKANLKESMLQYTDKTKEVATLKSELMQNNEITNHIKQQVLSMETKNKKLKHELKKCQETLKSTTNDMSQLSKSLAESKSNAQQLSNDSLAKNGEIGQRDERIMALKIDLSSTEERLKLRDEENDRLKNENLKLIQQNHRTLEQLNGTRQELESVKANGDRLTRESELVVENMNTWVKEQRQGNEKIANKLNYQNEKILSLEKRNMKLSDENRQMKTELRNNKKSLDERTSEIEQLKGNRTMLAEHESLLRQSKERVKNLEEQLIQEQEQLELINAQYQERHKNDLDTIQQLHKKLSELNRENHRQRSLLESQSISRKNLQAKLISKDSDMEVLRDDMNRVSQLNNQYNIPSRLQSTRPQNDSVSSLLAREIEKSENTSRDALQKSYWTNRIGELSDQLQRSSDYWSSKLDEPASL